MSHCRIRVGKEIMVVEVITNKTTENEVTRLTVTEVR